MKSNFALSILFAGTIGFSSCELLKAPQSVNEMNKKMDDTNQKMSEMSDVMKRMQAAVKTQEKLIPLQELMDDKNYDELTPVPVKLLPYAEKFAEAIDAEEFVKIVYLIVTEIEEVQPIFWDLTDEQAEKKATLRRMGRFYAIMAVAAFLPDETVKSVLEEQIQKPSRFRKYGLTGMMMRIRFTRDVFLKESLLAKPLNEVGLIKEALKYGKNIQKLADLPYSNKFGLKLLNLTDADGKPVIEEFDPKSTGKIWNNIYQKASSQMELLSAQSNGVSSNPAQEKKEAEEAFAEISQFATRYGDSIQ